MLIKFVALSIHAPHVITSKVPTLIVCPSLTIFFRVVCVSQVVSIIASSLNVDSVINAINDVVDNT